VGLLLCASGRTHRAAQYFTKPTKERQRNAENRVFYKGVREVEDILKGVLERHKSMGFK
jgi:hypothetical protein